MIVLLLVTVTVRAAQRLVVTNHTDRQRHEVIAVDGRAIADSALVIRDAFGIACPWQRTYDGELLLYVSVRPFGQAVYTIEQGTQEPMRRYVAGRCYPERADDIAFENDRAGFRIYGPGTQQRGERSFGIDLWVKHSSELMVDSLYRLEFSRHAEIAAWRQRGNQRAADSLTTMTSYHLDHGAGMDAYGVGPTLGCGTPALMVGDSICYPWCYEQYQILDDGPLRFTLQLDFPTVTIAGMQVTEHRVMTLDRGTNFCRMTVWYDGLTTPVCLAAGVAIRCADTRAVVLGDDYLHYADPTVDAWRHNSQIYVGLVFPEKVDVICMKPFPQPVGINYGHGLGIIAGYTGYRYSYAIGMAWSDFDVRSQQEWQLRLEQYRADRLTPLTYRLESGKRG